MTIEKFKIPVSMLSPSVDPAQLGFDDTSELEPLNEMDITFYREAVFLLKTYFFVYLGVSVHFGAAALIMVAVLMTILVYLMRLALTRVALQGAAYHLRDTAITSMMVPKGLAAAVLAGLPLQYGVTGGEVIRDTTYMVVLVSISLSNSGGALPAALGTEDLFSAAEQTDACKIRAGNTIKLPVSHARMTLSQASTI